MDAITLYKLMKPHLNDLNSSEKKSLINLISTSKPQKVSCHHRRVKSLAAAKKHLKEFCLREMEKEQNAYSVH